MGFLETGNNMACEHASSQDISSIFSLDTELMEPSFLTFLLSFSLLPSF